MPRLRRPHRHAERHREITPFGYARAERIGDLPPAEPIGVILSRSDPSRPTPLSSALDPPGTCGSDRLTHAMTPASDPFSDPLRMMMPDDLRREGFAPGLLRSSRLDHLGMRMFASALGRMRPLHGRRGCTHPSPSGFLACRRSAFGLGRRSACR